MENNTQQTDQETPKNGPELKMSGQDILDFIRKIFKAGNSRKAIFENEDGKKLFSINLFLLVLITFLVPVIALVFVIILITLDYSVSVERKKSH